MAVYTWINKDQLDAFLSGYHVGHAVSFKGIAEGVENSNYFLQTTSGFFILTLYEKRVQEKDLPFFLNLMNHLAAKGMRVAIALTRNDGTLYDSLAGRPAALISFLPGQGPANPSTAQCAQLGAVLAKMHLAAADFPRSRPNQMAPSMWESLLPACQESSEKLQKNLSQELADEMHMLQTLWPKDLPLGIIHGDLFCDNVLFDSSTQGALPGIIDFYFACNDLLAYDLAICLNAWCFSPDGAPLKEKAQAMINHYDQIRPLTKAERQALPLLCRTAAMRFLLTRLIDWQSFQNGETLVPPKNPNEYLHLMRFHKNGSALI